MAPALSFLCASPAPLQNGQPGLCSPPPRAPDQVTDNCPLLLAAPELGWALGSWPDCRGVGLVAGALPVLGTQKPSNRQPHTPCSLAHTCTLTSPVASSKVGGDLGLVPGVEEGSGARGCRRGGARTSGEHGNFVTSQLSRKPSHSFPRSGVLRPRMKCEGMEGGDPGCPSRGIAQSDIACAPWANRPGHTELPLRPFTLPPSSLTHVARTF